MTPELILGAAGSGKTRWTIGQTVERLNGGEDQLVLLPSQSLITDFRQRLIRHPDFISTDRLRIETFYSFVKTAAVSAGITGRELDDASLQIVLEQYLGVNESAYPVLLDQGVTDGLIGTLLDYFSDLQDGAVSPELVRTRLLPDSRNPQSRLDEIHRLYTEFSMYLSERGFVSRPQLMLDVAGWMRNRSELPPGENVLIDGFYEFNPVQFGIVECLLEQSDYCGITLLTGKAKLFRYTFGTAERIRSLVEKMGGSVETLKGTEPVLPGLQGLFDSEQERPGISGSLTLAEADSVPVEVQETIRCVKRDLMAGEYSPDEIAVLYRGGEDYSTALMNRCRQEGIPVAGTHEEPLIRNPAVLAMLQWFEVLNNEFDREDVLRWMQSGYHDFRFDGTSIDTFRLEQVTLQAQIIGGRGQWLSRLQAHLKREQTSERDRKLLKQLSHLWERLPGSRTASWKDHIGDFRRVIDLTRITTIFPNGDYDRY